MRWSVVAALVVVGLVGCADDPPTGDCGDTVQPGSDRIVGTPSAEVLEPFEVDVVVVGDSITADNLEAIDLALDGAGLTSVHYAAIGARRTVESYDFLGWRMSGVEAIASCLAVGYEPDVWLIELGTNDLGEVAEAIDPVANSTRLIDAVLDELEPAASIAWVTVLDRDDLGSSQAFNEALRRRTAIDPRVSIIDWYGRAVDRPDWFLDQVHPNDAGASALADLYVAEMERLVRRPVGLTSTRR